MNNQKGIAPIIIILVLVAIIGGGTLVWQNFNEQKEEVNAPEKIVEDKTADWQTYRNEEYGFEIKYPEEFKDSWLLSTVSFSLPLSSHTTLINDVNILVDKKLTVPLDGTYGGYYSYEEYSGASTIDNLVFSEEISLNNIIFKKDYWVAYGGMGGWDTVINCYVKYKNNYYIISLDGITFAGGIPGTITTEGKKITKEQIVNEALNKMRDNGNKYIKIFNQMLSTFRFIEIKVSEGLENKENPTIREIMDNPKLYEGEIVIIECKYGGWDRCKICRLPSPVNLNAVCVYNEDGCIYANGSEIVGTNDYLGTQTLDEPLTLRAKVIVSDNGVAILSSP